MSEVRRASAPDEEGRRIVTDLRVLDHDLVTSDESDEFQHWCGNWVDTPPLDQFIVEIVYREEKPRNVSVGFHSFPH